MELIMNLVKRLKERLNNLHNDSIDNHNIFVYYESQITLYRFKKFCDKYEKKEGKITQEIIEELAQIMINRLPHIAHIVAAPNYWLINKVETSANVFCEEVQKIYFDLASKVDSKLTVKKDLFMPQTEPKIPIAQAYDKLVQSIIKDLKEDPELNNMLAQSIHIDMKYVATRIKRTINNIEDNRNQEDLLLSRESKVTLDNLNHLLKATLNDIDVSFLQQLDLYVKLLEDRWNAINGREELSYTTNINDRVNKVCRTLANYMSLMSYRLNYLKKDPQTLLMPTPTLLKPTDKEAIKEAFHRLHKYVFNDLKNRGELIAEMGNINPEKWQYFVEGFELEKLNVLLTNNQTMDSFFKAEDTYNEDEERSRMLLICVYESYKKKRVLFPYHKTIAGSLFQYVTKVYNIEDKIAAANGSQSEFAVEKGLVNFEQALNDPEKLLKHKGALLDSEMKDFTGEVFKAIKKLPQKKIEFINEKAPERLGVKV